MNTCNVNNPIADGRCIQCHFSDWHEGQLWGEIGMLEVRKCVEEADNLLGGLLSDRKRRGERKVFDMGEGSGSTQIGPCGICDEKRTAEPLRRQRGK